MMTFEYKHFECPGPDLEAKLNELGSEGWRLHTCEPIHVMTGDTQWDTYFTVVMDRSFQVMSPVPPSNEIDRSGAIACRG